MDFTHTRISWSRPLTGYSKVKALVGYIIRGKSLFIDRKRIDGKEFLNIGCGMKTVPHFVNLDCSWHSKIDICWDASKRLPLGNETLRGIFSEHCLEHLPFHSIPFLLSECFRIFRQSGTIRLVLPDAQLYLERYANLSGGLTSDPFPYADGDAQQGIYTPVMSVNRIFRNHGHLYMYDHDLLKALLEKAGFVDIVRESFNSGRDQGLLIDDESRATESLYIEATKR